MGMIEDQITVNIITIGHDVIHGRPVMGDFFWICNHLGHHPIQSGRDQHFQVVIGSIHIAILVANDLTLLGQANPILDRAKRL